MRVLMQSRSNFFSLPGGDTIQLLKTKEQLEKMGVEVDISLEINADLSSYDIVHLSNVTRIQETYLQLKNAKKQNKPVVLSTIYWPMEEFEKNGQVGIRKFLNDKLSINSIERIKAIARWIKDPDSRNKATKNLVTVGYTQMQNYVIGNVDLFLPNSEMEMQKVRENFNSPKQDYVVVPNAIDADVAKEKLKQDELPEFEQYKNAVICVGRIETRKNQLALVKALQNSEYKLVLVGGVSPNHQKYFENVQAYINENPNFYYIPKIENEKLYQLYKVCKVSVLPSWLDTPGLVSLEAAAMGCNLAISNRGSTTEYFGEYADYCEPDNIESIKNAVDKAYSREKNDELQKVIFNKYTWKQAAEETFKGYKKVLNSK